MSILEALTAAVEAADSKLSADIGIRALHDDERFEVGDCPPYSHVWDDDVRTDICLGGLAAFESADEAVRYSHSTRFAIIAGTNIGCCGMPEDGAAAFRDAEVVAVLEF